MAIISQTEQLEMLLAVYDTGSFSAAAKALDCQVAKVSRAVQALLVKVKVIRRLLFLPGWQSAARWLTVSG